MTDQFNQFFVLTKVDEAQRTVYGRAAVEEPDHSREVMDYATSKPNFEKWSAGAQKRSGGKSKGNVREMHSPIAAGKVIDITFNDEERAIDIGTYCSDDATWQKILDGVLTGFSIGGKYAKRWPDTRNPACIRYTAIPQEVSYVDSPAMPSAVFTMVKADGTEEIRKVAVPTTPDVPPVVNKTNDGEVRTDLVIEEEHDLDPIEIPDSGGSPSPELIVDNSTPAEAPSAVPFQKTMDQLTAAIEKLIGQQEAADVAKQRQESLLKTLGARVGIARREGAPLVDTSDHDAYGDPANGLWPYGSAADAQTAVADFNRGKRKGSYSDREWNILGRRIAGRASVQLGKRHQYNPQEKHIRSEETMTTLNKADVNGLISQIQAGIGIAVDQIGNDPAAAKDLLMQLVGSLDGSVNATPVNTNDKNPSAPTGGAQGDGLGKADVSIQPPMTMTDTPTDAVPPPAPPATPDAYKDDLTTRVDALTEMVGKLCAKLMPEGEVAKDDELPVEEVAKQDEPTDKPVEKRTPIGDLAALLGVPTDIEDPILKALLSGDKYALQKAAVAAGVNGQPDVKAVERRIDEALNKSLKPKMTRLMMAQGFQAPMPTMKGN